MGGKNPGGRQSALEQLYLAYRQDVYRYLCSLTRNASDAEDLLSETFLRALTRLPFFRGDCSAKTWLFGIAATSGWKACAGGGRSWIWTI